MIDNLFKILAKKSPELEEKLQRAQMNDTPERFLKKVYTMAFMGAFAFSFLFILPILHSLGKNIFIALIAFPVLFLMIYSYFMKTPDLYISKIEKRITKEILFALRFLIIELESGILIYTAFENIKKNYPVIGKYFGEVIDKVDYGDDIEEALNTVVNKCPSENLRMVLVQIQNTMKTGADIVSALNTTVEQFSREEQIMVDEYSKKLNPIAMFYMIVAVIFPSIGFMMLIIITSFIGFQMDLPVLLSLVGLIGFVQFMFVSIVKSMRPPVDF